MSRPSEYAEEVSLEICARRADGQSIKKISADESMPARSTIYRWLADQPRFKIMFQAAILEHANDEFEALCELADETPPTDDKGRVDQGWVALQRVRIDTRRWALARMDPRFNERISQEITGAGGAPLVPEQPMDPVEAARRIAFALARADDIMNKQAKEPPRLAYSAPSASLPAVDLYGQPVVAKWVAPGTEKAE